MPDESIWDIIEYVRSRQTASSDYGRAPVLIGDSHTAVVFAAAHRAEVHLKGAYFAIGPQPAYDEAFAALHPDLVQLLKAGVVFSAVSQSTHDVLVLLQHPHPFDFVVPQRPDLPLNPAATLLPYGAIRDALSRCMARDFKVLDLIRSACAGLLIHILSPPPLEDNEIVASTSPWPLKEGESISPPALRLKAYLTAMSLFEEWCAYNEIEVLRPPPEAVDARGFLRPNYRSNATHGNVAYGRLVLKQMEAQVPAP